MYKRRTDPKSTFSCFSFQVISKSSEEMTSVVLNQRWLQECHSTREKGRDQPRNIKRKTVLQKKYVQHKETLFGDELLF